MKKLSGLLPICSSCKKIRDDKGDWNQIEGFIQDHSEAEFTHGICPDCKKTLYPDYSWFPFVIKDANKEIFTDEIESFNGYLDNNVDKKFIGDITKINIEGSEQVTMILDPNTIY